MQHDFMNRSTNHWLYNILNIPWKDFVTNIEVFEKVKITSVEAPILELRENSLPHQENVFNRCY